jgi:lactate permease
MCRGDNLFSLSGEVTDSISRIKVLLALLPFATLIAGFLLFRLSALMTAILTYVVEFVVVVAYFHMSPIRSIEAGLWGNLTMWSVFILLWSGQIFGQTFRADGLIPVLLDSFGSISPATDRQGRVLTMMSCAERDTGLPA